MTGHPMGAHLQSLFNVRPARFDLSLRQGFPRRRLDE